MTNTPEHTPGPWEIGEDGDIYAKHDKGVALIAIPCGENYAQWRDKEDDGKAEFAANARLITAAPELLGVLQKFVDQARVGSGNKPVTRSARVNCSAGIYHDAVAAILKATGAA